MKTKIQQIAESENKTSGAKFYKRISKGRSTKFMKSENLFLLRVKEKSCWMGRIKKNC